MSDNCNISLVYYAPPSMSTSSKSKRILRQVNKLKYNESILRNAVRIPVRNPTRKSNPDRVPKRNQLVNGETTAVCAVARKEPTLNNKKPQRGIKSKEMFVTYLHEQQKG